jgi:hypothetical protein
VTFVPDHIINQDYYRYYIQKHTSDERIKLVDDDIHSYINAGICNNMFRFGYQGDKITLASILKAFKKTSQAKWFEQQSASWKEKFQVKFAEVRTSRGIGFSFNLIDDEELLNFDE